MLGSVKCERTTASMGKEKESEDQDSTWHFGTYLRECVGQAFIQQNAQTLAEASVR